MELQSYIYFKILTLCKISYIRDFSYYLDIKDYCTEFKHLDQCNLRGLVQDVGNETRKRRTSEVGKCKCNCRSGFEGENCDVGKTNLLCWIVFRPAVIDVVIRIYCWLDANSLLESPNRASNDLRRCPNICTQTISYLAGASGSKMAWIIGKTKSAADWMLIWCSSHHSLLIGPEGHFSWIIFKSRHVYRPLLLHLLNQKLSMNFKNELFRKFWLPMVGN